ncbi:MAG TPA: hypothetical protein VIA18_22625 [Polyangia bacterium]|nr:hypothetical protein [Polyangia bacterium]
MRRLPSLLVFMRLPWLAIPLVAVSCASFDSRFVVEISPSLPVARQTVSIVGALKNGRLDDDYWRALQPSLRPLGDGCQPLFVDALQTRDPDFYDRLDQKSREDGVGDDLLKTLEPRAQGDLIMVVYSAGQPPPKHDPRAKQPKQRYSSLAGQHSGRGYHELIAKKRPRDYDDDPGLDLSLYFWSRAQHASVAQISLHYTGQSVDEAQQLLGDKLRALFSDFRCAGWR